jgi:hypothetical protein
MAAKEGYAMQVQATAPPPPLASRSSTEASLDLIRAAHPELAGNPCTVDAEIADFITRQVLERDAQFFDG